MSSSSGAKSDTQKHACANYQARQNMTERAVVSHGCAMVSHGCARNGESRAVTETLQPLIVTKSWLYERS
jgi:hypothetical protein